jgi:hypothetical protein
VIETIDLGEFEAVGDAAKIRGVPTIEVETRRNQKR